MLSVIVPIVFQAVKAVEAAVKGRKRGKTKKKLALKIARTGIEALRQLGEISDMPTAKTIESYVETAHQMLSLVSASGQTSPESVTLTIVELTDLVRAASGKEKA